MAWNDISSFDILINGPEANMKRIVKVVTDTETFFFFFQERPGKHVQRIFDQSSSNSGSDESSLQGKIFIITRLKINYIPNFCDQRWYEGWKVRTWKNRLNVELCASLVEALLWPLSLGLGIKLLFLSGYNKIFHAASKEFAMQSSTKRFCQSAHNFFANHLLR